MTEAAGRRCVILLEMPLKWPAVTSAILAFAFPLGPAHAAGTVNVTVDARVTHQTWQGFGATHESLIYGGTGDVLSASQRQRAVDALFAQVKISTGQAPTTFEAPRTSTLANFFGAGANDNADPLMVDPNGFFTGLGDAFKSKVVDVGGSVLDLYPDIKISTKYANKWLASLEQSGYEAFLNECAEQALAGVQYWQKTYGVVPAFAMLFNEPLSGNGELAGGNVSAVVDIVKRTGQRLAANGLAVRLVVPGEETEEKSLATATAIMNDAEARKYVGALAYHTYPYGSTYSYVPNVLSTSGAGKPDAGRIQVRAQLRDLGAKYGVPVWMTEVSHAYLQSDGVQATDFRILRGRAIHIHDELVYADAAAYFGMNGIWDQMSQAGHFGTDGAELMIAEHDTIVLIQQSSDAVTITSTGRAIGHYARFIRRGARRIDGTSSDPLLLITAFRDATQGGRLVLVAINNAPDARTLKVDLTGVSISGPVTGEQSTASAVWKATQALTPSSTTSFMVDVPGESVTTFAAQAGGAGGSGGGGAGGLSGSGGAAADAGSVGTGGAVGTSSGGGGGATSGSGGRSSGGAGGTGGFSTGDAGAGPADADGSAAKAGDGGAKIDSGTASGCSCGIAESNGQRSAMAVVAVLGLLALRTRRRRHFRNPQATADSDVENLRGRAPGGES
jgi:MYXO-CTERM domain-containing protein